MKRSNIPAIKMRILRLRHSSLVILCLVTLGVSVGAQSGARQLVRASTATSSKKRTALVIGNGGYLHARGLANPVNDATDISAALKELGFDVVIGTDLTLLQMRAKVREFGDKLKAAGGVGLIYYAGHGIQVNGRNYLIPVDADIPREDEVADNALSLDQIFSKLDTAGNGFNIVVLDACRNNPFARSWARGEQNAGLAQVAAPIGTFIAYSTSPERTADDGTGRNGLYTAQLLKFIRTPNLKIEETFKEVRKGVDGASGGKQVPWDSSSLRGDFYFLATSARKPADTVPGPDAEALATSGRSSSAGPGDELQTNDVKAPEPQSAPYTLPEGQPGGDSNAVCKDLDGQDALSGEFDRLYANKTDLNARQQSIISGETFLNKYGGCSNAKTRSDWLRTNLPKMVQRLRDVQEEKAMVAKFNSGLATKDWDGVYLVSRELMAKWPTKYSGLELVLGSIGYDELFNNNDKYVDETLQYAKQSLSDLEARREVSPPLGVKPFEYKSREDAIAWMNLTIGTLYQLGKKDKAAAQRFLYAATRAPASSDVSKNPNPYEFIGSYYYDQLAALAKEITALNDQRNKPETTGDARSPLLDKIKSKIAISNGIAERAMDAYARAYELGTKPEYKTRIKSKVAAVHHVRYGSAAPVSVDQIIATAASRPFADPATPITPIFDP